MLYWEVSHDNPVGHETCFREVCFAIERGEDLEPLRKAAIAVGLSEREFDATIKSDSCRGQERSKLTLVKAAEWRGDERG